jgi:hypothetical protein
MKKDRNIELNGIEYEITETDTHHILKSLTKSKNGLYRTIRFTKDKTVHEQSVKFISDFIAKELLVHGKRQ